MTNNVIPEWSDIDFFIITNDIGNKFNILKELVNIDIKIGYHLYPKKN